MATETVTPPGHLDRIPIGGCFRVIKEGQGNPPRWRWFLVAPDSRTLATCKVRGFKTKSEAVDAFEVVRQEMSAPLRQKFQRAMAANTNQVREAREGVMRLVRDRDLKVAAAERKARVLWIVIGALTLAGGAMATLLASPGA